MHNFSTQDDTIDNSHLQEYLVAKVILTELNKIICEFSKR